MSTSDKSYILNQWNPLRKGTKAEIDLWHERAFMFQNSLRASDRFPYFDLVGGNNDAQKQANFNNSYGTYHSRLHVNWLWVNAIKNGLNSRIQILEGDEKIHNIWTEPSAQATMQLFAMCGNGTRDEVKIYLSPRYQEGKDNMPVVFNKPLSYMSWFDGTIHDDIKHRANKPVIDENEMNRFGFNMLPTGNRLNNPSLIAFTDNQGNKHQYNGQRGDFEGLNQQSSIVVGNSYAAIHDYPEIFYSNYAYYHWIPIRFARALTDEELGYKLYINIKDYPTEETYAFMKKIYENHKNGSFKIQIEKKGLNESPSSGFYELPKGYLRGFYVQYMIEYPEPNKTIEDLLLAAQDNPYIFRDKPEDPRNKTIDAYDTRIVSQKDITDSNNLSIYPNPATDKIYIKSDSSIKEATIYNMSGQIVISKKDGSSSIDVSHLPTGMYILQLNIDGKESSHKVVKK